MSLMLAQQAAASAGTENETYLLIGLILFGVAVALLVMELFVPSGGLIGAMAGIAALGSIFSFFWYDQTWGMVATGVYLLLGPIAVIFMFRWWLHSPLGRGMILGGREPGAVDNDAEAAMSAEHARLERLAQLRQLIGAQGVAVTPLRPVGVVKIEGQRIDAMAESGVIDAATPIIVTDVYDNQVKVRAQ